MKKENFFFLQKIFMEIKYVLPKFFLLLKSYYLFNLRTQIKRNLRRS